MRVDHETPLAPHTTFRLGGPARRMVTAESDTDVVTAVAEADASGEPVLVLGGGSNLLVSDAGFPGTVVRIATHGRVLDGTELELAAGETWSTAVDATVAAGLAGVECLAGIPGSAGATPVQNVNAYGQSVAETITAVTAYDRRSGEVVTLEPAECAFSYRDSAFKRDPERYVILRVRFRLEDAGGMSAPLRYAETARMLGVGEGDRVPLEHARDTVLGLRAGKGMVLDPGDHDTWSAGSFFTNPVLDPADHIAFLARAAHHLGADTPVPGWSDAGGAVKLSAAWLIERAGFPKGHGTGPATISTKHTLALTNRGAAKTEDLLALAREVRDGVQEAFGVTLVNEPVMVGVRL